MPSDITMRDALTASDGLYTLVVKNPDGSRDVRVIGSIIDYVFARMTRRPPSNGLPTLPYASSLLTVTEGGYNVLPVTGEFDLANPQVQARTTFGLVCAGLQLRRERGIDPFTVMSCDNIQGNGEVAKPMFTAFATALDPEFGAWLDTNVPSPNSMVDRIIPVTTDADRNNVATEYGINDA
jgi:mannitol 2-dehydrogenase